MNVSSCLRPLLAFASLGALLTAGCTAQSAPARYRHPALQRSLGAQPPPSPRRGGFLVDGERPKDSPAANRMRAKVASAAKTVVGQRKVVVDGKSFRMDCSGVTRAIYARAGYPLGGTAANVFENDTSILFRLVRDNGSLRRSDPLPGDLVFFDDTHDRNGDGLRNDALTHVGVVERVLPNGTVIFVHRVGAGILRYRMNLSAPTTRRDAEGKTLNHYLRRAHGGESAKTTAQLFAGFGTVIVDVTSPPRFAAASR